MFSCEFFEIIMRNFFIKHIRRRLLNADDWKNPRDCWSKTSFFSPLRFLILSNSILMNLFIGCKNFIFKHLLKSEGVRESSRKILLCYQYVFHVWSLWERFKSFIKICFLHGFFSMLVSYHFGPGWSSGWSLGVRRSF